MEKNNISMEGMTTISVETLLARSPMCEKMGYFILESDPNPDYYAKANFPPNKHNSIWYLFFIIECPTRNQQESVLRNISAKKSDEGILCNIAFGELDFHAKNYSFLRMNIETEDSQELSLLCKELQGLGIKFKKDRKAAPWVSKRTFVKYTEFVEIGDGIYKEASNDSRYFFSIPGLVSLDELYSRMNKIKNNCNFHHFDSFLASLPSKNKFLDFVGIYSDHCKIERLPELNKEIKKLFA